MSSRDSSPCADGCTPPRGERPGLANLGSLDLGDWFAGDLGIPRPPPNLGGRSPLGTPDIPPPWAPRSLELPMPQRTPPLGWHWEAWPLAPGGAVPECWLMPVWASPLEVGIEDPYAALLVWAAPRVGCPRGRSNILSFVANAKKNNKMFERPPAIPRFIWYSTLLTEGALGRGPPPTRTHG